MKIRTCPNCGFTLSESKGRSNPQNRYLHGVILPIIAEHTGYTCDEVKDLLKSMFLRREMMLKTRTGVKEVAAVRGSSEISSAEFEKFTSDIRRWAAQELGLMVPEPNEHPTVY